MSPRHIHPTKRTHPVRARRGRPVRAGQRADGPAPARGVRGHSVHGAARGVPTLHERYGITTAARDEVRYQRRTALASLAGNAMNISILLSLELMSQSGAKEMSMELTQRKPVA